MMRTYKTTVRAKNLAYLFVYTTNMNNYKTPTIYYANRGHQANAHYAYTAGMRHAVRSRTHCSP